MKFSFCITATLLVVLVIFDFSVVEAVPSGVQARFRFKRFYPAAYGYNNGGSSFVDDDVLHGMPIYDEEMYNY